MVNVVWTVEEYTATFRDDDIRFVGQLSESGLFMPNVDGPNTNRSGNRNNVGDVWVVASYLPPGSEPSTKPLRARAHLLVTVPLYLTGAIARWGDERLGVVAVLALVYVGSGFSRTFIAAQQPPRISAATVPSTSAATRT
jgi:hypothetical protein